jgi:DNA-directed RNA polymerase subunit RPC12/RpoP
MKIGISCRKCKKKYQVAEEHIGKRMKCTGCGTPFRIKKEAREKRKKKDKGRINNADASVDEKPEPEMQDKYACSHCGKNIHASSEHVDCYICCPYCEDDLFFDGKKMYPAPSNKLSEEEAYQIKNVLSEKPEYGEWNITPSDFWTFVISPKLFVVFKSNIHLSGGGLMGMVVSELATHALSGSRLRKSSGLIGQDVRPFSEKKSFVIERDGTPFKIYLHKKKLSSNRRIAFISDEYKKVKIMLNKEDMLFLQRVCPELKFANMKRR